MRLRSTACFLRSLLGVALGACSGAACNGDEAVDSCYPRDSSLDWEGDPGFKPFCDWAPGGLPEAPEGYEHMWTAFVSFDATAAQPCDPCDLERFDALIKAEITEECDQPYVNFTRGCYVPVEESPQGRCTVKAIYASHCDPDLEE